MGIIIINEARCKGCGLCVKACPKKIIRISPDRLNAKGYHPAENFDMEKCVACAACALTCPDVCIEVEK